MQLNGGGGQSSLFPDGERVLIQKPTKIRGEKEAGILYVTVKRVVWAKGGKPRLSIPFEEVKSRTVSKNEAPVALLKLGKTEDPTGPGFVFEFISQNPSIIPRKERDDVNNIISQKLTEMKGKSFESPSKPKPIQTNNNLKPPPQPRIKQEERDQRVELLKRNRELRSLHEQLVGSKAITDDEFWESRKTMLHSEMSRTAQKQGFSSLLLSDVRPDSQTDTVHFKLTPQKIHQIFIERPAVKKSYDAKVPTLMTEQQFWTKYFEARHFYQENRRETISTLPDDDFYKLVSQEEENTEPVVIKRKLQNIDPTVDVSAGDADNPYSEGFGIRDGSLNPFALAKSLNVIRRYNRHSAIVLGDLENLGSTKKRQRRAGELREIVSSQTRYEDLEEGQQEKVIPLNLEGTGRYFEGRETLKESQREEESPVERLKKFQLEVANWTPQLSRFDIPEQTNSDILQEVTGQTGSREKAMGSAVNEERIDEDFKARLFHYFTVSNELLRHFWCSFPLTTQSHVAKLERMEKSMDNLYKEIESFNRSLPPEKRHLVPLILPIVQALDRAFEKYSSVHEKLST